MKIISKNDAIILSLVAAILIIVTLLIDPTPLVKWRAKHRISALLRGVEDGSPAQWKCFYDLRILKKRGHFFTADNIFAKTYAKMDSSSRLTRYEAFESIMSLSAEILRSLPPNSIYISNSDNETYPLWFLQTVQDIRYDIIVINRHLWRYPKYRKFLWKTTSLKNVISLDSLLDLPDTTIGGKTFTDLSFVAHKLAKYYPVFIAGNSAYEFPKDSLYFAPVMAKLYSDKNISDTILAKMAYDMLHKQNLNYLSENPPISSKEEFYNSRGCETMPMIFNTVMLLHSTGQDSLASRIKRRFDGWMMWNPYYIASRPLLAWQTGNDYKPWLEKLEKRYKNDRDKWWSEILKKYIDYYKKQADWDTASSGKKAEKKINKRKTSLSRKGYRIRKK